MSRNMSSGVESEVGTGKTMIWLGPTSKAEPAKRRWLARGERLAGGPRGLLGDLGLVPVRTDVRHVLDGVQATTLVMHRSGDRHVPDGDASDALKGFRLPAGWGSTVDEASGSQATSDPVLDEIERS